MALPLFADQIALFKGMRNNFVFKDNKNFEHIDTDKVIEIFKNMFSVKTLRTKLYHNKPVMYLFKDGVFVEEVYSYFKECCYNMFGNSINANIMLANLQSISYVDDDYFDGVNPYLLNLKNGVFEIKTKKLVDHHPDYKMLTMLPVEYNPDVKYDFMTSFASEVLDDGYDKVIQEMFGYCLFRRYFIQKIILMYGEGANGKDVVLYVLRKLLGKKNYSSIGLIAITNDRFASYNLYKRYANISGETPKKTIETTDLLKGLRGGSPIPGQRKFGDTFTFENYAKLIFACNAIPETMDKTFAFWRSWILIPFNKRFVGSDDNKKLKYELTTDERMSGILNYALDGLCRLLKQMDFSESKSAQEIEKAWNAQAESVQTFVNDCILEGDKDTPTKEILISYISFCGKYSLPVETKQMFWRKFNKIMAQEYPIAKDTHQHNDGSYYKKGVILCPD